MSYRLINANALAENCRQVNDMPCIYADLPNGLDGNHYVLEQSESSSRWFELFGTPERTVRTIIDGCCCDCYACLMPIDCPCFGKYRVLDDDAEKLLVWLKRSCWFGQKAR